MAKPKQPTLKTCSKHPIMPSYGSLCCDTVAEALERALDAPHRGLTRIERRRRVGATVWLLRYRADDMTHSVSEREISRATADLTKAAVRYSDEIRA